MVSTHLKHLSQIGSFPKVGVKIKNIWNHHLVFEDVFENDQKRSKRLSVSNLSVKFHTKGSKDWRKEKNKERWLKPPINSRILSIVGGWTNPFEKIWVKIGNLPQFLGWTQNIYNYIYIYIWNHQPVMNIAPEKWWWEDDGFLLGPGLFSGALCGKTSGEYSSWWWALILLDDRGCYIHVHHPQSYIGWRLYHDFKPPDRKLMFHGVDIHYIQPFQKVY